MPMPRKMQNYNNVGKVFYSYGTLSIAATASEYFLFKTNSTEVDLESVLIDGRTGDMEIVIYESPTIVDEGTAQVVHSYNRRLLNTNLSTISNSSVTFSDKGTQFVKFTAFAADAGGNKTQTDGISATSENAEWQLPPNKPYLIEIINLDATNSIDLNFQFDWIELAGQG